MAKLLLIVKYGFFVTVIVSAGFLTERLTGITRFSTPDAQTSPDLMYDNSTLLAFGSSDSLFDRDYSKCFTEPRKSFCLLSIEKRMELFRTDEETSPNVEEIELKLKNITSSIQPLRRRIRRTLVDFTALIKKVNASLIVIEPSMLFCVLSSQEKLNLLHKFNPGRFQGSRNIVTFGIMRNDVDKINKENVTKEILAAGFKIIKFRKPMKSWLLNNNATEDSFETAHYFFARQSVIIHVVVLYRKNSYLWHSGLDVHEIDFEGLLFVNNEAFENFSALPLNMSRASMHQMFIPSSTPYFLKELESSNFVECKSMSSNSTIPQQSSLTVEQLRVRILIALKEMKNVLAPELVQFWLWSKTLIGWYEECDILHHSATLELSLTSKSIRGLNFTTLFAKNEYLDLKASTDDELGFKYAFDCRGLFVNIFVLQEDDGIWYIHSNGKKKLKHSMFSLCSTDIFGQKINVPCNTEEILNSEYGKNWMNSN